MARKKVKPRKHPQPDDGLTTAERAVEPPPLEESDDVDEASVESFPASDPPSFTPTRAGKPSRRPGP